MSCALLTQVGSYQLDSQGKMPGAKKVEYICYALFYKLCHIFVQKFIHIIFVGACCLMAAIL